MKNLDTRKNNFIEKLNSINGHIYEYLSGFNNVDSPALFRCLNCNNKFKMTPYNAYRRKRNSCEHCKTINSKDISKREKFFLIKFKEKYPNNEFTYIQGYMNLDSLAKFKCNNCGNNEYLITPSGILKKKSINCNKCRTSHNIQTLKEYILDIEEKYPNMYNIDLEENCNYKNSDSLIIIKCNKCNNKFKSNAKGFKYRGKCSYCNMTKLEKYVFSIIKNYFSSEDIDIQVSFDGLKYKNSLKFDFYISKINLVIEVDGKQHYSDGKNYSFGDKKEYEKTKLRDNIKNKYCLDNNIKLIRIKYDDNIDLVLKNYFNKRLIVEDIFTINI